MRVGRGSIGTTGVFFVGAAPPFFVIEHSGAAAAAAAGALLWIDPRCRLIWRRLTQFHRVSVSIESNRPHTIAH
jgi:hypothetical protein